MSFTIETPRLILREFVEEDWQEVHDYAKDMEVAKHMNWGPNTEADTREFIALAMTTAKEKPRRSYHLAVVSRHTGKVIGGATLRMLDAEPDSGELGYTFHPQTWGQGFATEVAKAFMAFGFLQLNLRRIWATCRPGNHSSFRILRKSGMRFEEYLQNEKCVRGEMVDSLLCGVSREEWLRTRAAQADSGIH
jgi:RimJ/RimL family protein N-acetyltransferase